MKVADYVTAYGRGRMEEHHYWIGVLVLTFIGLVCLFASKIAPEFTSKIAPP